MQDSARMLPPRRCGRMCLVPCKLSWKLHGNNDNTAEQGPAVRNPVTIDVYLGITRALYAISKIRGLLMPSTQFAMDECLEMANKHKKIATNMTKVEKRIRKLKKKADAATLCPDALLGLAIKMMPKDTRPEDDCDTEKEISKLANEVLGLEVKIKKMLGI